MKRGDKVKIYNATAGGKQILEGVAKLIEPSEIGNEGLNPGFEYWQVEFIDQTGVFFDRIIGIKS